MEISIPVSLDTAQEIKLICTITEMLMEHRCQKPWQNNCASGDLLVATLDEVVDLVCDADDAYTAPRKAVALLTLGQHFLMCEAVRDA